MTAWVVLASLAISTFPARAAEDEAIETMTRQARAVYAKGRIKVDGALNEADWLAVPAEDRIRLGRREGSGDWPVAECLLLYDNRYLYIGARCRQPTGPSDREVTREGEVLTQDYLAFYFDREEDGHSYLMFAVGPAGFGADLHASSSPDKGLRKDLSYTSGWQVAASRGDREWLVEARIPLKALGVSVPDRPVAIGFDMGLRVGEKGAEARWSNPDVGVIQPGRFGSLAIGDAPLAARFRGVEVTSADDGWVIFDIHNPGWNSKSAEVRVRLKSDSRAALTSQRVELAPLEGETIRVPVALVDPRATLEVSVAQIEPPAVLNRQEVEFAVGGVCVWSPKSVCRAGQIALPVGYTARTPLPDKVSATVTVYASEGGVQVLASRTTVSGGSGMFPLDVSSLRPGRYEIRLDVTAQARPASCSLVVVPQSVRLGSEWAWNPEQGAAAGAGAGTTP